jgi:cytochrome c
MSSARFKAIAAGLGGTLALLSCATQHGGTITKTPTGINLGATGPHPVQPLPDKPRFGQQISEADVAAWNIDIRAPDGKGLPPGRGTVAEGEKVYAAKCVSCHGPGAKGGPVYGAMVGGIGSFTTDKRVLTPGSMYPYAPILFDYIRRSMPMDAPQTLTNNEVYAVSAYLLHLNGLLPANGAVDQTTLVQVQMPNRNGFIVDDRPDVRAGRCMSNC